jgi:hypothetical protein
VYNKSGLPAVSHNSQLVEKTSHLTKAIIGAYLTGRPADAYYKSERIVKASQLSE